MSVTQTYYLAHQARGKLSSEASRADHNLRLLVGHANLLDSLMLELAEAEQEQESWFNQSVKKASKPEEPRHIQWADAIAEEEDEDEDEEDSDSDSEYDSDEEEDEDEDIMTGVASMQRMPSQIITTFAEVEDEDEEFDDEEDLESLTLTRTKSHSISPHSPPDLMDHDDSDSSEDDMPPSPPSDILPTFSEKQRQQIATTGYYSKSPKSSIPASSEQTFFEEGLYLPQRPQPGLISAISVY